MTLERFVVGRAMMLNVQPIVLSTVVGKLPLVRLAPTASSDEPFWYDPSLPVPPSLCAFVVGKTPRARITSALLLSAQTGAWLVRRSVFETTLLELDVSLVPVAVHDAKGLVDDDWVLLHIATRVAVDRVTSTFDEHEKPTRLSWREAPAVELFRLTEHPLVVCCARALFERLHRRHRRSHPALLASPARVRRHFVLKADPARVNSTG